VALISLPRDSNKSVLGLVDTIAEAERVTRDEAGAALVEARRAKLDDVQTALLDIAEEPAGQQVMKVRELEDRCSKPRGKRSAPTKRNNDLPPVPKDEAEPRHARKESGQPEDRRNPSPPRWSNGLGWSPKSAPCWWDSATHPHPPSVRHDD
jgi:hypothetical protein